MRANVFGLSIGFCIRLSSPMAVTSSLPSISSASFHFSRTLRPDGYRKRTPSVSISTNPSLVDPIQLRDLLSSCNLSCHRFPALGADGRAEPVDPGKLRVALAHSFVVVSVFCRPKFLPDDGRGEVPAFGFEELFGRGLGGRLVGFGRAVSDGGLTASIHDVVVIPSLQRQGIGRKIVERIIRVLSNRGIYDISALCTEKERLFFKACGFGHDPFGATTMMYTRTATNSSPDNPMVRSAGRMLLLVPLSREQNISKRSVVDCDHMNQAHIDIPRKYERKPKKFWTPLAQFAINFKELVEDEPQWLAVGWIDPNNKFCTKIDTSGSSNPTWKTKFSVSIDDTSSNLQSLSLTIEVYRREPIFLREKLEGTAIVQLKEFLAKFVKDMERSGSAIEETGSFQLRKRNSGKPQGFVDISLRISDEKQHVAPRPGVEEGFRYSNHNSGITLAIEDGPVLAYPTQAPPPQFGGYGHNSYAYGHHVPPPVNNSNTLELGRGYHRPPTPPPPPPPSNAGFLPMLFPGTSGLPETYINLPPSRPAGQSSGPGFAMGLGGGALAAGAVIFGDDFMSAANIPAGFDSSSLTVSADPPF